MNYLITEANHKLLEINSRYKTHSSKVDI